MFSSCLVLTKNYNNKNTAVLYSITYSVLNIFKETFIQVADIIVSKHVYMFHVIMNVSIVSNICSRIQKIFWIEYSLECSFIKIFLNFYCFVNTKGDIVL